jgi:hypothetical protein
MDPIKSRPSIHGLFGVVAGIAAWTQIIPPAEMR